MNLILFIYIYINQENIFRNGRSIEGFNPNKQIIKSIEMQIYITSKKNKQKK